MRRVLMTSLCVALLHVAVQPASPAPAAEPPGQLDVIVGLRAEADLEGLAVEESRARGRAVVTNLQDTAEASQQPILALLAQRSRQGLVSVVEPLWVVNAVRVRADRSVIAELAGRADVDEIRPNLTVVAPEGEAAALPAPNQALVGADAMWGLGYRGGGVVVGSMDTGVWGGHPDLAGQYRGGTNSWFDPHGEHATPFDVQGHGTMTMGVMVGRDAGGSTLGTAPDAQWVAAKIFDDRGEATLSAIHQGFQWLLDPDGNPATGDAPAVVNNSWALGTPGCDLEFQADLQALRAAAIVPVFAAGNYGPAGATATSPANYPEALSVGATDAGDSIWSGSSRGPTTCGGSTGVYPDLVAPGVGIPTTDLFDLYTTGTGTSVAAPHVAGAVALLLDAFPGAAPVELESALMQAARDLGDAGADDVHGHGRLDILAAYEALLGGSIGDLVFDDRDGDGMRDEGEPGVAGVGLRLLGAGPDGEIGTADDTALGERVTDGLGAYVFDRLAAGNYRIDVDPATVPDGAELTTGNIPYDVTLAPHQDLRDADFGFRVVPPPAWVLSFDATVVVGQDTYGPEDVAAFDGSGFSLLVDGSDIGLGGRNLDALHVVDGDTLILSLADTAVVNGVGTVADADLLRFDATSLGATTSGTLSLWFDGSDVGLTRSEEDVDALGVLADGRLVVSAAGRTRVGGVTAEDEDLLAFTPATLGSVTAGTWAMWLDGSDVGLRAASENVDGVDVDGSGLVRLSTTGAFSVPDGSPVVTGGDESVFDCQLTRPGATTECVWAGLLGFDGAGAGLPASADVDAVGVR